MKFLHRKWQNINTYNVVKSNNTNEVSSELVISLWYILRCNASPSPQFHPGVRKQNLKFLKQTSEAEIHLLVRGWGYSFQLSINQDLLPLHVSIKWKVTKDRIVKLTWFRWSLAFWSLCQKIRDKNEECKDIVHDTNTNTNPTVPISDFWLRTVWVKIVKNIWIGLTLGDKFMFYVFGGTHGTWKTGCLWIITCWSPIHQGYYSKVNGHYEVKRPSCQSGDHLDSIIEMFNTY